MGINPGLLRHSIYLQALSQGADDGGGGTPETWADSVGPLSARAEHVAGNETLRGMQVRAGVTEVFEIRYRAGVTTAMRIRWGARSFNIRDVADMDERRERLLIQAEEVV
jgi:SPP1 family predicted phage head-tail adaptor